MYIYIEQSLGVMFWDDMFRDWDNIWLSRLNDHANIQLIIWNFSPDLKTPPGILQYHVWNNYASVFGGKMLGGAAYKGVCEVSIYISIYISHTHT